MARAMANSAGSGGTGRDIMELLWIPISVFAALMQAVRTAAQKSLNARLSTWMTTYVRSLFGLPFMLVYLWAMVRLEGIGAPSLHADYILFCAGAANSSTSSFCWTCWTRATTARMASISAAVSATVVLMAPSLLPRPRSRSSGVRGVTPAEAAVSPPLSASSL